MALEEILEALSNHYLLEIVKVCNNESKKVNIISSLTGYTISDLGKWIRYLEKLGVLEFSNEGWKTTKETKKIIEKYFT